MKEFKVTKVNTEMVRRVFFSFHYRDVENFRANVVRNSEIVRGIEKAGFYDASLWEQAKTRGVLAIKNLIDTGLQNTSVTAVLIGTYTYSRRWVRYEIVKSIERGNGLLGVHINKILDKSRIISLHGANAFHSFYFNHDSFGRINLWERKDNAWKLYQDVEQPIANLRFFTAGLREGYLSSIFPVYDWVDDQGYNNFCEWVEQAAKRVGR